MDNVEKRDFFPGGNTSLGFFSYYDYIIEPDATRIFIVKGGPGVGKSSFMKKVANNLNESGFNVEFHHCSSDPNSLDGVVFPQIGVAMIDGTSPHVVDPRNPGAVDEILHLGDYWNEQGMRNGKRAILTINHEVGRLFKRAYQYLKAAKVIHDDLESIYAENLDIGLANEISANLTEEIFNGWPVSRKQGKTRKLFISAITPIGFKNYLEGLTNTAKNIYVIEGPPGSGKATLLAKLAAAAEIRGINCEAFYCAFDPYKIEHIYFPALDLAVTTNITPHRIDTDKVPVRTIIDMGVCIDPVNAIERGEVIAEDRKLVENLLDKAILTIAQAKTTHDKMEEYYIPNMDFAAINDLSERITNRILKYAEEQRNVSSAQR